MIFWRTNHLLKTCQRHRRAEPEDAVSKDESAHQKRGSNAPLFSACTRADSATLVQSAFWLRMFINSIKGARQMLERPIRCQDCSHSHPWVGVDAQYMYAEQMVMSISMQRVFSCISLIPLVRCSLRPLSLISMLTSYFLSGTPLLRRHALICLLSCNSQSLTCSLMQLVCKEFEWRRDYR